MNFKNWADEIFQKMEKDEKQAVKFFIKSKILVNVRTNFPQKMEKYGKRTDKYQKNYKFKKLC